MRFLTCLALTSVVLLALGVRGLGYEWVFVGDEVIFPPGDAMYHVRRSLYTFLQFPAVLMRDPYINYPDGASVPWPPLFDFVVGGVARGLVETTHGFEVVAAWAAPAFGALSTFPVYLAARQVGTRGVALGAAAFFAVLPVSVNYGRVGNADHHAAVVCFGAWLLFICMFLVRPDRKGYQLWLGGLGLALGQTALVLTWHGSLLYLVLLETTLLVAAVLSGRRDLLTIVCATCLASLALLAPVVYASPVPLGGAYSAIALSRLHLLALVGAASAAGVLLVVETVRPAGVAVGALSRLGVLASIGLLLLALVLLLPGPREGLAPALSFLTLTDVAGPITGEQFPLFAMAGRDPVRPAVLSWGYFAYLIPLAPLALLALSRGLPARAPILVLAAWGALFGFLAITQRRYGNDLAPAATVSFALLMATLAQRLATGFVRGPGLAAVGALIVGVALLSPPLYRIYLPRARGSLAAWQGHPSVDRALKTPAGSLVRFLSGVRRATPETSGYFDPDGSPEYGIVAHANLGHAVQYIARRPTPTDPFWAYIGPKNWNDAFAMLGVRFEREALTIAERLRARYMITMPSARPDTIEGQLHLADGVGSDSNARLERFRLITEGPRGGRPLNAIFDKRATSDVPYKLFEIVAGAILEARTSPGGEVVAEVDLRTPTGREFTYSASVRADEEGLARLRVPYATQAELPTFAQGPYRVHAGDLDFLVAVSEADVRDGLRVPVRIRSMPKKPL